jgi:hypothetical protein
LSRFFTLLEAEALLPQIDSHLRRLMELKNLHEQLDGSINEIHHRISVSGGMIPPRGELLELKRRKAETVRDLKTTVDSIQSTGCQIKDVDTGLIDFPTLYHGKEVLLCWKLGEQGISFWHHVEDGFQGRRSIDSEFLSNHRGDSTR